MTQGSAEPEPEDVPTFTECVIGYREWRVDVDDQLCPISSAQLPWLPGANTASCDGRTPGLRFEWIEHHGERVLVPAPRHLAPHPQCECGLYSWRRPLPDWYQRPRCSLVLGAVASWGRLQVHHDGFRAERACVVTLAYHPDTRRNALEALGRIATHYRADLVPLDDLERAACRHGTPLPDTVGPPASPPARDELSNVKSLIPRALRERFRSIPRAESMLEARRQRAPTDDEMANELGVTTDELQHTYLEISNATIAALDKYHEIRDAIDLAWLDAQRATGDQV